LLLLALASIGLTLWVTWQLEGGGAAVNEAGRMRMQTWELAQALPDGDPKRVAALIEGFEQRVELLRTGDPARPLFVPGGEQTQQTFMQVQREWGRLRAAWAALPPPTPDATAVQAEAFVRSVDAFVSAIEQQLARTTSILNAVQFAMVALLIFSAVVMLYSAYLFIFNPLSRLQAVLARMEGGDLTVRVQTGGSAEFGAVAEGFNRMAHHLQALYANLESKVREKTASLEAQHARMSVLYQSAAFVARARTLDELAKGIAQQVRLAGHAGRTRPTHATCCWRPTACRRR